MRTAWVGERRQVQLVKATDMWWLTEWLAARVADFRAFADCAGLGCVTAFFIFKIRETPTYQTLYFLNTLRVIKLILLLSLSQIFFRFKKVFLKEFGEDYKLQPTDKLQKFSINSKFVVEKMNVSK